MNDHERASESGHTATLSPVFPAETPSLIPEELARRRRLYAEAQALREEIGSIGIPTDELIRQVREEADAGGCG